MASHRAVTDLLQPATIRHQSLWSADNNALLVPVISLIIGERAFSVADLTACNSLPTEIRTTSSTPAFKKELITFLFSKSYDIIRYSAFDFMLFSFYTYFILISILMK